MASIRSSAGKWKRWFADLSIHMKLIGAYIVIILVPVIVISNYLFAGFYQDAVNDIIKENRYQLKNERQEIMSKIEVMEKSFFMLISDRSLGEYVTAEVEPGVNEIKQFQDYSLNYLQSVLFNNPNIASVRFFVNNPRVSELWPIIYQEERIKDSPMYTKLMNQKDNALWEIQPEDSIFENSSTMVDERSSSMVALAVRLNLPNQQHIGIVKVEMRIEDLFDKAYNNSGERDSRFFIIDQQSKLYTNSMEPLPGLNQAQILKAAVKVKQEGEASLQFSAGGEDFLYLLEPIDRLHVDLVNVISLHGTYSTFVSTRNKVILLIILLLVVLAVVTYWIQSIVLKKLHVLRESMHKVRNGDFHVEIDVQGGDEIGELARHFREMLGTINGLIAEAVQRSAATKEAELQALRNQIDAHFLYNTLENLKMLAEVEGQYTVSDALTSLGSIMRYNLRWTGDTVQLADELKHIQHYISIMNIRYDEKLKVQIHAEDRFHAHELLKMSLQPIVENAVKHGMYSSLMRGGGLIINVHAYADDHFFYIDVTDNGIGIPVDGLQQLNHKLIMSDEEFNQLTQETAEYSTGHNGIGLRNVNQRIRLHYGEDYGICVESRQRSYTTVRVKLPLLTPVRGGMQSL
ncbi:histidine kinase [Paenibacillus sp. FSL H3-0469]|uniref:cache domain-containing sensor histidine kinase n=1 Tax=Paenibacillus sp. FSL H3-0469 TaxID=2954506 RepID=UPI0031016511